jgi:nitrile hydratase accessory protein
LSTEASAIGILKARPEEAGFSEPWQAEAMAIAALVVEAGYASRSEWSELLGAEIRIVARAGKPDTPESYYECVLGALERLAAAKGLVSGEELARRREAWIEAYEHTPHGQPVVLPPGA